MRCTARAMHARPPARTLQPHARMRVVHDLTEKLKQDRVTNGAAALAFYWMLAVFPAMIFVLTALPYLPIPHLEQAIMDLLRQTLPAAAASLFEDTVKSVVSNRNAGLLSVSAVFAIWSGSAGTYALMQELDAIHDACETRPFWKARAISLLLAGASVLLILGSLGLAVLGGVIQGWLGARFGFSGALLAFFAALRWVIIAFALLVAIALVYTFGPSRHERRFALFTPGTVVGTLALALASFGFRVYVGHFASYDKMYGSLGAVIALLMWLYVAGLAILVGAEIDTLSTRERRDASTRSPFAGARREPASV